MLRLYGLLAALISSAVLVPAVAAQDAPALEVPPDAGMSDTISSAELRAQGLFVRGMTRARLADHAGAVEAYEGVLDLIGEDGAVMLALAQSHRAQGNIAEALFYAERAVQTAPESHEALAELAAIHQASGRYEAAVATYEQLLARHPEANEAWIALADLHEAEGQLVEAVRTAQTQWERDTTRRDAGLRLLRLLDQIDQPRDAIAVLETLIAEEPTSFALRLDLARRLIAADDPGAASDVLATLRADYPTDRQVALLMAQVYQQTGEPEAAADLVASAAVDDDPEALFGRAAMLFNRAQNDASVRADATKALQGVVALTPRADALRMLALLHADEGQIAEAAQFYARAVDADPRQPDWWAEAIDLALRANDPMLAARLADDALLFFPGQAALVAIASQAFIEAERFSDAALALRTLETPTADQLERLGDAEEASGDLDAAREAWSRALELDPDRASVQAKLDRNP